MAKRLYTATVGYLPQAPDPQVYTCQYQVSTTPCHCALGIPLPAYVLITRLHPVCPQSMISQAIIDGDAALHAAEQEYSQDHFLKYAFSGWFDAPEC